MKELTREMIIEALKIEQGAIKLFFVILCVVFVTSIVISFIKFRKYDSNSRNKYIIVGMSLVMLLLLIPLWMLYKKYDALNYSIENNCWSVEKDVITEKRSSRDDDGDYKYHVVLSQHGKFSVTQREYFDYNQGEVVYVIIAKGRFGGTYTSKIFYSTSYYHYYEQTNL